MKKFWNRFSTQIIIIIAMIVTSGALVLAGFSMYNTFCYKYIVSQNGYTYTGRVLRDRHGLFMVTEDGRYVILYDAIGPIEMKLKENK